MKLSQRSGNSTAIRFLITVVVCSIAIAGELADNTLDTGRNLFTVVPASVLAAGTAGSFWAYKTEDPEGYCGCMPNSPFNTLDRVDDLLFGKALPVSSAALWIAGMAAGSDDIEGTGEELCRGLLYTYGITQITKLSTARTRPDGTDTRSFPSGHAAGTSCTAVVLWHRYGADVGIPAAAVAVYTCLSRVNLGRHFPSDVLMGAAVGAACGIAASMVDNGDSPGGVKFSLSVDTEGRITPGLW
ncbi:MAG: phosphatase PAP2 family protein [Candidatus Fermentibacteraceae bacterium]|nr:phosphatase PAP2 family protein [Candidatus Fermentibacteraceae bacterium]